MVDYFKVVFTKTLDKSTWVNTELAKGNLADEINKKKMTAARILLFMAVQHLYQI